MQTTWRRERDSNPRYPFGYIGFQDRLFQPLTHPSAEARNPTLACWGQRLRRVYQVRRVNYIPIIHGPICTLARTGIVQDATSVTLALHAAPGWCYNDTGNREPDRIHVNR